MIDMDFYSELLTCIQCCEYGMFIPEPGSRILIFTHSGSRIQKQQQKRGVKKNFLS
jgi:hypothetical protein